MPNLKLEGATYPPPHFNEVLSNVLFYVRMACILMLMAGPETLQRVLGVQNLPWMYHWAQDNKMTSFLILFLVGGQIETQLLSTGAFEVYLNDIPVWSKLESGRLPTLSEIVSFVQEPQFLEQQEPLEQSKLSFHEQSQYQEEPESQFLEGDQSEPQFLEEKPQFFEQPPP